MAYSEITNAQVAAGASINTALMTALRDNFLAVLNREAGAPAVVGFPYDYQEFLASGTWTKPANAEAGDKVVVHIVGGGGGGATRGATAEAGGGSGGAGTLIKIPEINDLLSSVSIAVGAGGAARTGTEQDGLDGGSSEFGLSSDAVYILARGGKGGSRATSAPDDAPDRINYKNGDRLKIYLSEEGLGGITTTGFAQPSVYGGGGGGANITINTSSARGYGAVSTHAGNGGEGTASTTAEDGQFPGGGGGAASGSIDSGAGANGVVRVWCIRES